MKLPRCAWRARTRELPAFSCVAFPISRRSSLWSVATPALLTPAHQAFECPKCGFRNNSVQSAAEIKVQGVRILLDLKKAKDLDRQVVRTEKCTYDALLAYLILSLFLPFLPALVLLAFRLSLSGVVCFPELELSVSPSQGTLTTVQGVIQKAMEDLAAGQAIRAQKEPEGLMKRRLASITPCSIHQDPGHCYQTFRVPDDV